MRQSKIKIGLLLENYSIPAWTYCAIEKAIKTDFAELTLLVFNQDQNLRRNKHSSIYDWFKRLDHFIIRPCPDASAEKKVHDLCESVKEINVNPIETNGSQTFNSTTLKKLYDSKVDVFIKLGFGLFHRDVLSTAKYGIWTFYFKDGQINQDIPSSLWKSSENKNETEAGLKKIGDKSSNDRVLCRSYFRTNKLSSVGNQNACYWNTTPFLYREIHKLSTLGENGYFAQVKIASKTTDLIHSKEHREPNILQLVPLLSSYFIRLAARYLQKGFYREQWLLLYNSTPEPNKTTSTQRYTKILPPIDRLWADPHIVKENGVYYIFIEELIYDDGKGYISLIEMDKKGKYKTPVKILERAYHLSYPFIFKWQNTYYMIPESEESNRIELYECTNFPYHWKHKMNLQEDIKAVDSTLFFHQDKWWLFTSIAEARKLSGYKCSFDHELFLFYADDFRTNQWQAHPLNPIVTDVKNARSAGKIFTAGGKIYRPAQDCSVIYGYAINFNEILVLSETEYKEQKVSSIAPHFGKNIIGTHTFARKDNITVIDAFQYRRRLF